MLDCGDLSWIVPGQIIAFSSPTDGFARTHPAVRPQQLIEPFRKLNVKGVIRLNDKLYNAGSFEREGVQVHELEFPDGSNPEDHIIQKYIALSEKYIGAREAIAVHCRAGLGRTGTLIGCYIMNNYNFDAKQLIAWMRICRPGMVVGEQQQFMVRVQNRLSGIVNSASPTKFTKSRGPVKAVHTPFEQDDFYSKYTTPSTGLSNLQQPRYDLNQS